MQNVVYFNSEMAICLRGIHGIGPSIAGTSTCRDARTNLSPFVVSAGGSHSSSEAAMVSAEQGGDGKPAFRYPFGSMLPWFKNKQGMTMKGVVDGAVLAEPTKDRLVGNRGNGEIARGIAQEELKEREGEEDVDGMELEDTTKRKGNWVFKILRVRSLWSEEGRKQEVNGEEMKDKEELGAQRVGRSSSSSESAGKDEQGDGADEYGFCEICQGDDDENKIVLDRDSFSKFLKRVPLEEAKLYAQLSYLGNLAYDIPNIKPENLLGRHGLHYLTSSIEKRQQMVSSGEKEEKITCSDIGVQRENEDQENSPTSVDGNEIKELKNDEGPIVSATSAFQIAASAASFLHSRTRSIFASSEDAGTGEDGVESVGSDERDKEEESESANSDMASFVATTDSVTAVVSAKEEVKQAVADDLNSISSAPCEWFICDDDKTSTRFFVIQGSETLASWQANLLFEPIEFEEVGVFVHRGIYEAAKGMYLQMLPEIHAHLKAHGKNAKFRFSGHSLGGSLSLLINLMLLIREEVPLSSLLPVVTFGSPCIMCGGDALLCKLGLPRSHIQAVTMHRDIVPRAFSCSYPSHVAELLKAISGNFRNHPCLNKQLKWLYSPMGELIILQPDPNFSPQHELLPSESGLYLLACSFSDAKDEAERQLRAAKNLFLNSPHPLEILSNRAAYGNGGTIQRDHDMRSYLKCVRNVLRQELIRIRKAQRKRKKLFWSIMTSYMLSGVGVIVDRVKVNLGAFNLLNLVRTGGESFKRFGRLVASHHIHLWVALLIPARLLLIRICSIFSVH